MCKNIASFLFLLLSCSAVALTEKVFIESLLNNNAFFKKEHINLTIKKIEMDGDRANYGNWHWDVEAELGKISKQNNKDTNYTYAHQTKQTVRKLSTDLSKNFFIDGSKLSLSYDRSWPVKDEQKYKNQVYSSDVNTTEYLEDIALSWTLPLLKNKQGVIDQRTYDLAVLDYEDEELVLVESKEAFIASKLEVFIDWVSYQEQIKIVKARLEASKNMLAVLKQKQFPKNTILILQRSIDKVQRQLLDLESKFTAEQKALAILVDHISFEENPPIIDWNVRVQLVNNLPYYISKFSRAIQRIEIEKAKNQRYIHSYKNAQLADLDFTVAAIRDNNKGNYSSYSQSRESEYQAKLEFSYPLTGNITNQVYLDTYRLKRRQLELKYQDKFDDILSDAEKLTTELTQGVAQLDLYQSEIQLSQSEQGKSELDNLLAGVGNIRFVIDEQDDHQELMLGYIEVATNYHKNRIEYDGLLDRLLSNAD